MARTGLRMMPTSPLSPLRFRTAGFPRYGSKAGLSDGAFPNLGPVKPAPGMPFTRLRFASVLRAVRPQRFRHRSEPVASCVVKHRHASDTCRFTPGALAPVRVIVSRSIITYPAPSAPLAGTSHLHRPRLICDAFAVRERLGDPRVVPRFHLPFLPSMSPSMSPGSLSLHIPSSFATSACLRREISTVRHSQRQPFRGLLIRFRYNLLSCSPPYRKLLLPGFRRFGRPLRRRISLQCQLGNLHWRDSHPLEWQLASLHDLPVPVQGACVHARVYDHAGSSECSR